MEFVRTAGAGEVARRFADMTGMNAAGITVTEIRVSAVVSVAATERVANLAEKNRSIAA
jgi:hypothetical protein